MDFYTRVAEYIYPRSKGKGKVINPYGFDTKIDNLYPNYQFYDVDVNSIRLGIMEKYYPKYFLRRYKIFQNKAGRAYGSMSNKLVNMVEQKKNNGQSLIDNLQRRRNKAFKDECSLLTDRLARQYRRECQTIDKRVKFWTNMILYSNQKANKKEIEYDESTIISIFAQLIITDDFFNSTRRAFVGNKILSTSEMKGSSLRRLITTKGVKKDLQDSEQKIIDALAKGYSDALLKEINYTGQESIQSYISNLIIEELNKGVKEGLFYSIKKGNTRSSKKSIQGFKNDFKEVMERVEKSLLNEIQQGKIFKLDKNNAPVFKVSAKLDDNMGEFFTTQFTISGLSFKETGIDEKDLNNIINIFVKSCKRYVQSLSFDTTIKIRGKKVKLQEAYSDDITLKEQLEWFVMGGFLHTNLISCLTNYFLKTKSAYGFMKNGYFNNASYKGMLAELSTALLLTVKGANNVRISGNKHFTRNDKIISKSATDITADSFKIDRSGNLVTNNEGHQINFQIKNLESQKDIVAVGAKKQTSSIFSPQIFTYFTEEQVYLMRFIIANYKYAGEVLNKASSLIEPKQLKKDFTILAYKNITNFLRVDSILENTYNTFFVINGLYFPCSVIYDLLIQQLQDALDGSNYSEKNALIEPIMKKNPDYRKYDELGDVWMDLKDNGDRYLLTKNSFGIDKIRAKNAGVRFKFKGISIDLKDLI